MNGFEFSQTASSHSLEKEPGPLATVPERLSSLLTFVNDLWSQYDIAKKTPDYELRFKLSDELNKAYDELESIEQKYPNMLLPAELRVLVDEELSFACHNLSKVLKYYI